MVNEEVHTFLTQTVDLLVLLGQIGFVNGNHTAERVSIESIKCLSNLQTMFPEMRSLYLNSPSIDALVPLLNVQWN